MHPAILVGGEGRGRGFDVVEGVEDSDFAGAEAHALDVAEDVRDTRTEEVGSFVPLQEQERRLVRLDEDPELSGHVACGRGGFGVVAHVSILRTGART